MAKNELQDRIKRALHEKPGLTARELAKSLGCDKSDVNSALYMSKEFRKDDSPRPRWFLDAPVSVTEAQDSATKPAQHEMELRTWQKKALRKWNQAGRQGIIEAVTGAGKTRVGLAAIAEELEAGGRCAVIVPTKELRDQWLDQIEQWFPDHRVGSLASGSEDTLADHDVVVAIVNSASRWLLGLPTGTRGLLVADECHRYGADEFSKALEDCFDSRLGLSATYARSDGRHLSVLEPYFGSVLFTLGYREAIAEGVIANFVVATMGVDLRPHERREYDELSEKASKARSVLIHKHGVTTEPFSTFIAEVNDLADSGGRFESMAAKRYLTALNERRAILASAKEKIDCLGALKKAISESNGTLVFTQSIEVADSIVDRFDQAGLEARAIHSKLNKHDRQEVFQEFASGSLQIIVAPRVLDEGVDVPEADLAVIVSASRTRRQMVQRMGRVLRLKDDGRLARFVLVYVKDTPEDPSLGAHDAFFEEVLENASAVVDVESPFSQRELARELAPFQ